MKAKPAPSDEIHSMNQAISPNSSRAWTEAQQRAETYLSALCGRTGPAENALLEQAIATAREESCEGNNAHHPITLVMESLFALLSRAEIVAPLAITPPLTRASMLPEKIEFPLHEGMRRLFGARDFPFAGTR